MVSLNSPFPPAGVRGSSYWCGRNRIKYFSKYPSWQSIDQRVREHFSACSPEWAAVSQRTFSMLSPLFTSIYYCWTGFSISKCPKIEQCGFFKHSLKLHLVPPPKQSALASFCVETVCSLYSRFHVKPKKISFTVHWTCSWCIVE